MTTVLTGSEKMPQIFKALVSITAWAMWIISWLIGLSTFVMGLITGALYGSEPTPMIFPVFFALALAYAFLAVVVMRLRQKME